MADSNLTGLTAAGALDGSELLYGAQLGNSRKITAAQVAALVTVNSLGLGALATLTPGAGVATALAIDVGTAGGPVLLDGAGGTPSSLTLTNATGLPVGGISATGTLDGTTFLRGDGVWASPSIAAPVNLSHSLTGSEADSTLSLATTWNTTGAPTAIKLNVTDTASNASSQLLDLQVGGSSMLNVDKGGDLGLVDEAIIGPYAHPTFGSSYAGIEFDGASNGSTIGFLTSNSRRLIFAHAFGLTMAATLPYGWSDNTSPTIGSADTLLYRDAAGTLALRNGLNGQTLNIYNTFTDSSNYERLEIKWDTNTAYIRPVAAGTGTGREMRLETLGGSNYILMHDATNAGVQLGAGEVIAQARRSNAFDAQFRLLTGKYGLTFGSSGTGNAVAGLNYAADGIVKPTNGQGGAGAIEFEEMGTAPSAGTASARLYAEDDGAGKTRLMVIFPSGAAQQIAIEP